MFVVGIDPSITRTGIAIATEHGVTLHCATSKGTADATWTQRYDRLRALAIEVAGWVPTGSLVVMESPSYNSKNSGSAHDRSGFWWYLYDALRCMDCHIVPVTPTQRAKYGTGKGNAGKDEVLAATVRRYPEILVRNNDEADALLLAAIGCRLIARPLEESLPKAHLEPLSSIPFDAAVVL